MSKVFKFGGASVKNPKAIYNLKKIVSSYKENLVIVISAIDKTTNKLELVWKKYLENENFKSTEIAREIIKFHEVIIEDLELNNNTDFLSSVDVVKADFLIIFSKSFIFSFISFSSIRSILLNTIISCFFINS